MSSGLGLIDEICEIAQEINSLAEKYSKQNILHTELSLVSQRLDSVIAILDAEAAPIEILADTPLSSNRFISIIDKLGIGNEIVALRKQGSTIKELSAMYKLSTATIQRFFKYYDSQSATKKSRYNTSSVFDTVERLEELQTIILRNLHRLEGNNDEVAVKYISELRQTLALAVSVSEKLANAKAFQELKELVATILMSELPHRRKEIVSKIKSVMELSKGFLPEQL